MFRITCLNILLGEEAMYLQQPKTHCLLHMPYLKECIHFYFKQKVLRIWYSNTYHSNVHVATYVECCSEAIIGKKVKVKVSHSLIAVGAVGVRVPLYLGHSWWKAEPIPLLSLPYPSLIRKRYPFSAGLTERVFQSPHGAAEPRTHAIRRLSAP